MRQIDQQRKFWCIETLPPPTTSVRVGGADSGVRPLRAATNSYLYGVTVKTETNPGAYRLARYELCRFCCWSSSVNPGQIFLQPASPACVGATAFTFRTSLDRAVRLDGYRCMVSLALRRI